MGCVAGRGAETTGIHRVSVGGRQLAEDLVAEAFIRAGTLRTQIPSWSVNTLSGGLMYVDVRELRDPVPLRQTWLGSIWW